MLNFCVLFRFMYLPQITTLKTDLHAVMYASLDSGGLTIIPTITIDLGYHFMTGQCLQLVKPVIY